jgi:hypothetical protein
MVRYEVETFCYGEKCLQCIVPQKEKEKKKDEL